MSYTLPPAMYFGRPYRLHRDVFIVEDAPSSIRVAKNGFNAVALLGTAIRRDQLPELLAYLAKLQPKRVLVALDPDANYKAKKIAEDLTSYWPAVKAITTTKDPKWWSQQETEGYAQC